MQKEGYQFEGWYVDPECTKKVNPGGILPRVTQFYQHWIPVWYPIEYDLDGGTNSRLNPRYTSCTSPAYLLQPAKKKDMVFAGWSYEGQKIHATPTGVIGSVKIKAIFEKPCIVHFHTFGGQILNPMQAIDGQLDYLPEPRKYGYRFEGWFWDQNFNFPYTIKQYINESCVLYAKFEESPFTVTYDAQGGISSRSNPTSYCFDDPTILIKPAFKKGYIFDGWYDQIGRKHDFIRHHSLGDLHLVAKYKKAAENGQDDAE